MRLVFDKWKGIQKSLQTAVSTILDVRTLDMAEMMKLISEVLLEAPWQPYLKNSVLLTVDLTQAVVNEAIARKDSIIIAYRKRSVGYSHSCCALTD